MNDNTIVEILKKHLMDNYVKGKGFASDEGRMITENEVEWIVEEYVEDILCKSMDDFMRTNHSMTVYDKEDSDD